MRSTWLAVVAIAINVTIAVCIAYVVGRSHERSATYGSCQEDEVFDWSQNGGDYPDDIEWGCVPFDDLIEINE